MSTCPNKNLKAWKELEKINPSEAYYLWNLYDGVVPDNYYIDSIIKKENEDKELIASNNKSVYKKIDKSSDTKIDMSSYESYQNTIIKHLNYLFQTTHFAGKDSTNLITKSSGSYYIVRGESEKAKTGKGSTQEIYWDLLDRITKEVEEITGYSLFTKKTTGKSGAFEIILNKDAYDGMLRVIKERNEDIADIEKQANERDALRDQREDEARYMLQTKNNNNKVDLELNNKLKDILVKVGISVEHFEDFQKTYGMDAVAVADMIDKIIRINENKEDVSTLPEETAHFIIELLGDHPLAQRLQNLMSQNDYFKTVLGDEFDTYNEKYKGNRELLIKEAAGKLLGQAMISNFKGDTFNIPNQQLTLMQRLWNYFTKLFTPVSSQSFKDEVKSLYENTADSFLNNKGDFISLLKTSNIKSNIVLAQLTQNALDKLKISTENIRNRAAKRMELYKLKGKKGLAEKEKIALIKLSDAFDDKNYLLAATNAVNYSNDVFKGSYKRLGEILTKFKDIDSLDIREAAKILRDMKSFKDSHMPILKDLYDTLEDIVLEDEGAEEAKELMDVISELKKRGDLMERKYHELSIPIYGKFLTAFVGDGPSEHLIDALKTAEKDLSLFSRLMDALSEAGDPILQLTDIAVKDAKLTSMQETLEINKQLLELKYELEAAGIKDTNFMYERLSDGTLTGNIISEKNLGEYAKALKKQKDLLFNRTFKHDGEELYIPQDKEKRVEFFNKYPTIKNIYNNSWKKWFESNTKEKKNAKAIIQEKHDTLSKEEYAVWYHENVKVSEATGNMYYTNELIEPSEKYDSEGYVDIQSDPLKKKFYNHIIELKRNLDNILPENMVNEHLAPQLRKDFIERISDAGSPSSAVELAKNEFMDSLSIREDSDEYGSRFKVTDESGKPVNILPIYYTRKLNNINDLSTDIISTMSAYALMANDYHNMSKIVDILELGKDLVSNRDILQRDNSGNVIKEHIDMLGRKIMNSLTKKAVGSNAAQRLEDYFNMVIYGHSKVEGKALFGTKLDSERLLDLLGKYTALNGLALNLYAGIQNPLVGNSMIRLEAIAGEYVTHADLLQADLRFTKELPKALAQIGRRLHTNFIDLWRERFDVEQGYGSEYKEVNADRKTIFSRLFKSNSLFFMGSSGEYYMQCKMSFALANNMKLKDSNGNEITMLNAYELKNDRLVLKEGITKSDGSAWTLADERRFMLRQNDINNDMQGIYNYIDRSAMQQYAIGRLIILFRKFMVPGYNRRFRSKQYRYARQSEVEGYYRTSARFMLQVASDLKHGQFLMMAHWNELTPLQKRNMYRTIGEVSYIMGAMIIAGILNGMSGTGDDDEWELNMLAYQMNRLITELSFYAWPGNTVAILNSPAAGIDQINKLLQIIEDLSSPSSAFKEIERGKYKGMTHMGKHLREAVPMYKTVHDYMWPEDKLTYFTTK